MCKSSLNFMSFSTETNCKIWLDMIRTVILAHQTEIVTLFAWVINRGYSSFWSEYEFYFIEGSEKILYFMSAEGTNEIYNFSLHEMK